MLKISERQYAFIMRLVNELGLFLGVLEHNKVQSHLIKQQLQKNPSLFNIPCEHMKITVC